MTTFEKRSTGTDHNERDSHREQAYNDRDSHRERDGRQQHAGVPTAASVMSMWSIAGYDYALQVLKAQQQFTHSMLAAAAPMLDAARDITSADAKGGRSANNQMGSRSDERHDGSHRSLNHERYNDDDTAEHNNRSTANNRSDDNASDSSRSERSNTQTEEPAKTRGRVTANTTDRKLS
jgi:hypothetical protein